MMNRFQTCVSLAYSDGHFAQLASSETWRKDLDQLGDGLFRYLILELSTHEDCETWAEAMRRVDGAVHELEQVLSALRKAHSRDLQQANPLFSAYADLAESSFVPQD
jgi:hypothetical protein